MADGGGRLMLGQRIATVLWFLLGVGFLLALPVLLSLSAWVFLGLVAFAVVLAAAVAGAVRWMRCRSDRSFLRWWASISVGMVFLLSIIAAAPIYYLSGLVAARPLTVPQAVLSNGKKTIIFQGMSHVGSETFYKTVVYDLQHAIADGYVIYYEGVKPDPAGDAWFSKTLADGGDLNANYKTLGEACGLAFQGQYFQLLAGEIREHPERHVAADVTTLQLKQEYERLLVTDSAFAGKLEKAADDQQDKGDSADVLAKFLKWSQDGDPRHHSLGGVICRGVLDLALLPRANKKPSDLDPLLLDYRNRSLVARIEADPRSRIYVNYGSGHLPGIIKLLQNRDPQWRVVSVKWMRAIDAPESLTGQL